MYGEKWKLLNLCATGPFFNFGNVLEMWKNSKYSWYLSCGGNLVSQYPQYFKRIAWIN